MARAMGLSLITALMMALAAGRAAAAGPVELVSRVDPSQISGTGAGTITGTDGDFQFPSSPSLSADGRYLAFVSLENNLVPGQQDLNGTSVYGASDVFLQDLLTGATKLVSRSVASATTTGNQESGRFGAALSADGRWVAFISEATDLVPGQQVSDYGESQYVFLFDAVTETTTLVATTNDSNAQIESLAISADGRYVTFTTSASDILPGQPYNPYFSVYLYDRTARELRRVDHKRGFPNLPASGFSVGLGISADGRYALYTSAAGDLVAGQKPGDRVFLYDWGSGTSVAVGPASYAPANAVLSADGKYVFALRSGSSSPTVAYFYARETRVTTLLSGLPVAGINALSADGRYALFTRGDGDNDFTLVLYDRVSRTSIPIPRPAGRINRIAGATLSADGRYAMFLDPEPDVLPGQQDRNVSWDLFLFDRTTQKTVLVSRSGAPGTSPLTTANAAASSPAISANGSRIAFASAATDLVADAADFNGGFDLFAYTVSTAGTALVTRHAPELPSLSPDAASAARALSADGRWVAFESGADHLIAGQTDANGKTDVFLYDRTTRQTLLVSRSPAAATATGNGASIQPSLSADGRYVSFLSTSTDLVPGAAAQTGIFSVYVFDRTAGTTQFVARADYVSSDGTTAAEQRISADGHWVAFASRAEDLVPGQHQNTPDLNLFLWSRDTGSLTLLSGSSVYPGWTGYGASASPALSADGRYVAFKSTANDLLPGQTSEPPPSPGDRPANIFLYDRVAHGLSLVSHTPGSALAGASAYSPPSISADGRFVVFESAEGNLAPGVDVPGQSLYLYDRTLAANQWIAPTPYGDVPRISADGGTVAFIGDGEVIPGITPATLQVYLYDRIAQTYTLASPSRLPGGGGSRGENLSAGYAISDDGRYVVFGSDGEDLVPGQIDSPGRMQRDLFLFDRASGATILVSRSRTSGLTATGQATGPLLSADGRTVAFTSGVGLADGDFNSLTDAYLFSLDAVTPGGPVTLPPCTLFDGAALRSNARKVIAAAGACGVPSGTSRVMVKVTALQGTAQGNLRLYPGDVTAPPAGTLRFQRGKTATASFDVPLATNGAGTLALLPFVRGNGTVRVIVEVDGYTP